MKRLVTLAVIVCLGWCMGIAAPLAAEGKEDRKAAKATAKRERVDSRAKETLDELFQNEQAKKLFDTAHGYAVFGNWKFALGISGGGGNGVAVDKQTGERTYMKMGTGGVGLGIGGKKYSVVLLFQTEERFKGFVDKGWQADAGATAAAGTASADAGVGFVNGIAVYQFTESGLMAQADIAGTKYWKDKDLNSEGEPAPAAQE